jgi:hypothetical protein
MLVCKYRHNQQQETIQCNFLAMEKSSDYGTKHFLLESIQFLLASRLGSKVENNFLETEMQLAL